MASDTIQVWVGTCPQDDPNYFHADFTCPFCGYSDTIAWAGKPQHGDTVELPCDTCARMLKLRCFGTYINEYGIVPKLSDALMDELPEAIRRE